MRLRAPLQQMIAISSKLTQARSRKNKSTIPNSHLLIPKSGHGLLQSSFGADFSLAFGGGVVHQIIHGQFPQRNEYPKSIPLLRKWKSCPVCCGHLSVKFWREKKGKTGKKTNNEHTVVTSRANWAGDQVERRQPLPFGKRVSRRGREKIIIIITPWALLGEACRYRAQGCNSSYIEELGCLGSIPATV